MFRPSPRNHSRLKCSVLLLVLSALFVLSQRSFAQDPAQDLSRRLILKDGSYQIITTYEVKGDRVRYFSAEREEWEELPTSLVDFPATEKYEKDRAAGAANPEAVKLDKEIEHQREVEAAQLPQVAPGLRLPEDSGVFLLDSFQGEPQLVEIQQTAGDINRKARGNIFRDAAAPVTGVKQTIELDGAHATVQTHADVPSIYLNIDDAPDQPLDRSHIRLDAPRPTENSGRQEPQQPQQASVPYDRFRIVNVEVKNGRRIVGDVKRSVNGKVSQDEKFVKTTIDRVSGGWLKITPIESLHPGEYAVVEMFGKEGMNLYVWDFGFNPKAPANANSWKPETKDYAKPEAPKN